MVLPLSVKTATLAFHQQAFKKSEETNVAMLFKKKHQPTNPKNPQKEMPSGPRRLFFKTMGLEWAHALKTAKQEADYPHTLATTPYNTHPAPTQVCYTLAAPREVPLQRSFLPTGCTLITLKAWPTPEGLNTFTKATNTTHLFCTLSQYEAQHNFTNLPSIVVCKHTVPTLMLSKNAPAPTLFLFEGDAPTQTLHTLFSFSQTLPQKSDIYIGNIQAAFTNTSNALWQRLALFLEETRYN